MSRIDLQVPYEEKNAAKNLGAKWDSQKRVWYIPAGLDPRPFDEWVLQKGLSVELTNYAPGLWAGHGNTYNYLISGFKSSERPNAYKIWRVYIDIGGGYFSPPVAGFISFGSFLNAQNYMEDIESGAIDQDDVLLPIPVYPNEADAHDFLFSEPDEPYSVELAELARIANHLFNISEPSFLSPNVRWEIFSCIPDAYPDFVPISKKGFVTSWGGVLLRVMFETKETCLMAFDFSDSPVCVGFTILDELKNSAARYLIGHAMAAQHAHPNIPSLHPEISFDASEKHADSTTSRTPADVE